MPDEKPARPLSRSTIKITAQVIDREDGSYTDTVIAEAEVSEAVAQATTGDRYEPILPVIEHVAREVVNKTLAQVVANEALMNAREA